MAPSPRRTTGKAAPVKGAASAVSATVPDNPNTLTPASASAPVPEVNTNVETDPAVTVHPESEPDPDREALRNAAALDNLTTTPDQLPKVTEGVYGEVGAVEQPSMADMEALRRLADTSGLIDPATPYPADGITAPNPLDLLPEPRNTYNWLGETDGEGLTGRVVVDGWRGRINNAYRFARLGDRITAPADVMRSAEAKGAVIIEE